MKKLIPISCFLLTLLIPIGCNASSCPELYNGKPIEVKGTVELCNTFFVSLYDKQNQRVIGIPIERLLFKVHLMLMLEDK